MNLDLEAISAEFLNQCGSCDFGLPYGCVCAKRDFRPVMLGLFREVERLRKVEATYILFAAEIQSLQDAGEAQGVTDSLNDLASDLKRLARDAR